MSRPTDTMQALRLHEPTGIEGIVYEEAPQPFLGIGDVLVRVHASSFTPTELEWPSTWVDRAGRDRRPIIPCHEVSGVVEKLGDGTTGLAVGDEVFGLADWYRDGAAADYVAVEARNLARKPASVDHVAAAAASLAGLTAWQALFDLGRLDAGQRLLILGAGGGVGSIAVQLARNAGALVMGTGYGRSRRIVEELGVDEFVDVDDPGFDKLSDIDVVADFVGGELLDRSWPLVRDSGAVVSVVDDPQDSPRRRTDVRSAYFVVEADRDQLVELAMQLDSGRLRPIVGATFALSQGRDAFASKRPGGLSGKVVLVPS